MPAGAAAAGGLALVALIGVSWTVAGVLPCDAGCPAEGSASQAVHNTVGLLGYLGGAVGLLWLGAPLKRTGAHWHAAVTTSCGVVALAALAAAVFGWMLFTATRTPAARASPRTVPSYQRVVRPTPIMRPCMIEFGARNDALSALVVT